MTILPSIVHIRREQLVLTFYVGACTAHQTGMRGSWLSALFVLGGRKMYAKDCWTRVRVIGHFHELTDGIDAHDASYNYWVLAGNLSKLPYSHNVQTLPATFHWLLWRKTAGIYFSIGAQKYYVINVASKLPGNADGDPACLGKECNKLYDNRVLCR